MGIFDKLFGSKETHQSSKDDLNPFFKPTLEEQLEVFKSLDFRLNPDVELEDLNRWGDISEFENLPYTLLYATLGQRLEREPWSPITNKVWDFDTEAIHLTGSYIKIIRNLERISRGELKFLELIDYVDIFAERASVSFKILDEEFTWELAVNENWVDTSLFKKIVDITNKYNTKGKFTYYDTGGQNVVIGYETLENLERLTKATGLKIKLI